MSRKRAQVKRAHTEVTMVIEAMEREIIKARERSNGKKATIVIVDDEQPILRELRFLLGRTYNIYTFENPLEAERFVEEHPVDMVISDELMPEMRGSELLARIHKKHPDICNVVLSGQAEKDDIVKAVNEGHIFSFLYKPVDRQQLLNVIEKGLENRLMKLTMAQQNVELKKYSENLEKMVEEKTKQLIQAYDKLKMLDQSKMNFLLYLAHEMDSSLDRIQRLAETLLNYFAIAGTELRLEKRALAIRPLVDTILTERAQEIRSKNLTVRLDIGEGVEVMADPGYFKRVMEILIENAIEFTPKDGTISIEAHKGDQGHLVIKVSDTGKGIEEGDLERIFTPFVIESQKRRPGGFGLNLPLAKYIVLSHGGSIWAESKGPGRGASFFVAL